MNKATYETYFWMNNIIIYCSRIIQNSNTEKRVYI